MSTPETPSQNPTPDAPSAPDADRGAPSAEVAQAEASRGTGRNGHAAAGAGDAPHANEAPAGDAPHADEAASAGQGSEPSHDAADASEGDAPEEGEGGGEGGETAHAEGAPAGAPGAGGPTEKKRRRRRRKKKPGAHAGAEGAAAVEGAAHEGAAHEGGEAHEGEGGEEPHDASAEGTAGDRADARPKKREKRPGPPRERPPVNGGDIVFGKILEITDEAIFVDIPGKARAIFDRREMLLPEEEEAQGRAERAPKGASLEGTPTEGALAEGSPAEGAAADGAPAEGAPSGEAGAAAEAVEPAAAADLGSPLAAPVEAPAEAAAPEAAPAEPPREPKVPRVILEMGADFIGVVHNDGARGGLVVLTHHPRRAERAKPAIEKAFNEKTFIDGLVTGVIKGGIEVDVDGVRAFAPGSHVDLRLGADLGHLVGKRLSFAVTQYAKRGRDVVLSRKSMLEDEARKARTEALARLKVGEELDGVVRSVVPFGAFVDVGGIEGLVPLKEMSHNRADGPSDVFKAGEATRVRVVMIDDKGKVWLSRKATIPDPWQQVAQRYATGTRHTGKVARLQPFGAFVELEPGVDGLIHTQDLSIKRIETPEEVVKVGDSIEVVVSHVDASQHKIALHPAPSGDAAGEVPQRVQPHKPVKAKVVNVESGGLVVRILGVTGRNARGYVTAAGTGTPRGTELRKAFNVGQEIEAKVIEMDPRRGEVKLSIKALSEDQERNAYQQYRQQLKAEARFTFADVLAKKGTPSR
jgi:small subunit ribosomal protein S1